MKYNIGEAISILFKKENVTKVLVLIAAYSLIMLPYAFISLLQYNPGFNLDLTSSLSSSAPFMGFVLLSFISFLFVFPLSFYLWGYLVQVYRSFMSGEKELPAHRLSLIGLGAKYAITMFLYMLGFLILAFAVGVIFAIPIALIAQSGSAAVGGFLGGLFIALGVILFFIVIIVINIIIVPTISFRLTVTDSIGATLNINSLKMTIAKYWKDFAIVTLILGLISAGVSVGVIIPSLIPFVGIFVSLAANTFVMVFSAIVYGQLYKYIYENEKGGADQVTESAVEAETIKPETTDNENKKDEPIK